MEDRLTPKELVEEFLNDTEDARELSQKCRDYYDHKQWTPQEAQRLRQRKQAPIVVNRIKPKVEGMVGLYELRKSDPKAFPRTRKHEEASHVVTDGLRYVADNTDFTSTRLNVAEDFFVEGYGGAFVNVRRKGEEIEIRVDQIPWDRIYFDPHSRLKDFSDARFMGMFIWMDSTEVQSYFPNRRIDVDKLESQSISFDATETTSDRPIWAYNETKRTRVRLTQHFEKVKDVWKMSIFSGDYEILPLKDSPYLDEDKNPMNPIELVSANIDRDNNRYGEVAGFLSQQDEINHRRSKFLHLNSMRQTYGNENAIQDVGAAKKELGKPDGHLRIDGDAEFGKDFGIIPTQDFSSAQFNLYQDAKGEMDRNSFSAPLAGNTNDKELSGVALDKLQQGSSLELNRQYSLLSAWEKRIYEQIWSRIKQFWSREKWIRVTDNQDDLRWVGFNTEVTAAQMLSETAEDESLPLSQRQEAQKLLNFLQESQNPRLGEIVEVKNETAMLDMDIVIDQSFDVVNIQQEQFQLLTQFAQGADIDILEIIELSQLRGKDELVEKIEKRRAEQAQAAQQANQQNEQLEVAERKTKIQKSQAETAGIEASTVNKQMDDVLKQLEAINLANSPDDEVQVSV